MADKNNANIGFEKQIWDAACVLWGHIPAAEYRNVIIGLIRLDKFYSTMTDDYEEENAADQANCYYEFASEEIEDVRNIKM